eukprot:CAMPEP_0201627342 /NCGR_PEP_ID=MMETSP0493-20130528/2521_1 /ASSEMBLY_ACC=CAM_ASM_000838 /TAXON_ID=420259 /ORGANISM="Thalassiosira gravida, Strain GMp14c1" /LENGTH=131 /DNA_ID=CAMNT_0048097729 /DNA_START=874 /DNA_END=1269 /DNA_ORIENTATION=-
MAKSPSKKRKAALRMGPRDPRQFPVPPHSDDRKLSPLKRSKGRWHGTHDKSNSRVALVTLSSSSNSRNNAMTSETLAVFPIAKQNEMTKSSNGCSSQSQDRSSSLSVARTTSNIIVWPHFCNLASMIYSSG